MTADTGLVTEAWPGELDHLRSLARTLTPVAEAGDLNAVQRQLAAHQRIDTRRRTEQAARTPDFFQPGRTYTEPDGSTDWAFRCDAITTHPEDGERTALGWRRFRGEWTEIAYGEDDYEIHLIADAIAITQGDSK